MFATTDTLNRAMDYIKAAPKDNAPIDTLCYRPDFGERVFETTLRLDKEHGVLGDRWEKHAWLRNEDGSPDKRIQVCVLGRRVLETIWTNRQEMPYPGDTIIADMDFSYENLPVGSQIQAGTAIITVSDVFNDACVKWKARYGVDSVKWINSNTNKPLRLRGVLCEISTSGMININDVLRKI